MVLHLITLEKDSNEVKFSMMQCPLPRVSVLIRKDLKQSCFLYQIPSVCSDNPDYEDNCKAWVKADPSYCDTGLMKDIFRPVAQPWALGRD